MTRRPRRERSATESLLSIALGLEAVLVFFVTLVVYGLRALEPAVAFGGGAALFVLLLVASAAQRWKAGVALGAVLQVALLATGSLVTLMYPVGALFLGIWIYCFVKGRSLDRTKAAYLAAATPSEGDNA